MTTRPAKQYRDLGRRVTEERSDLCRLRRWTLESLSIARTSVCIFRPSFRNTVGSRLEFILGLYIYAQQYMINGVWFWISEVRWPKVSDWLWKTLMNNDVLLARSDTLFLSSTTEVHAEDCGILHEVRTGFRSGGWASSPSSFFSWRTNSFTSVGEMCWMELTCHAASLKYDINKLQL